MDLHQDLNPQQVVAVTHGEGPQLVLAGAGSGKTRVITYRIAWLVHVQGIDPSQIAAVTFTNKAAREMHERVQEILGQETLTTFVGTFHRFAVRLLRRYGERVGLPPRFTIFDTSEQLAVVRQALRAEQLEESAFVPRMVLSRISAAKNRLMDAAAYEARADGFLETRLARVYRRYQGLLRQARGTDFDDLIALAVKLLTTEEEIASRLRRGLRYLMVDEYQDTNHAQLRLIQSLVGEAGNLTAVGDEDQGIYRWRGADLDNILQFEKHFPNPQIHKLERNYRSTQNILDASGALVAHNEHRHGKRLWTDTGAGESIELYTASDEGDEARWVVDRIRALGHEHRYAEMAVLVRTNAQTRALEEELLRLRIPYDLVAGVRFYERAEIKDLVAYLRVLRDPRDALSLSRILNQPPRGIGKATQELLRQEAEDLGESVWDVLRLDQLASIPARGARALRTFRDLILDLQQESLELPLAALLEKLLQRTGYADLYQGDDPEAEGKRENIREFLSAAQEFTDRGTSLSEAPELPGSPESLPASEEPDATDSLSSFLDHIALVSDVDTWQQERGVTLMTLHSAKGLEFPMVIVAGLEQGILPHYNSKESAEELEEERRLLYVGMTRARKRLLLSNCRRRRVAGRYQDQVPSPFLAEIPTHLLTASESPQVYSRPRPAADGVYSFFQGRDSADTQAHDEIAGVHKGTHVRHPTLGKGVVLDLEGEGENAKLTVFFQRAGKRKLVAKYAGLEVL